MKYQNEIMEIIKDTINLTESVDHISLDTDLQNVGMDSLTFVRVVIEIENLFNVEFPDEKLIISQAGTVKKLCTIVMEVRDKFDETIM